MKNLETLLEYQKTDVDLRRVLDLIERSEEAKRMNMAREEFAKAKKAVDESEMLAKDVTEAFDRAKEEYAIAMKKLEEIELTVENAVSDEDFDGVLVRLETLRDSVAEMEMTLTDKKQRADAALRAYAEANETGHKMRKIFNEAKAKHAALVGTKEGEIAELRAKLKELEPKVDEEIMAKYKMLTGEQKYPAFVEAVASDGHYSCRGCGMMLSEKNKSALVENDYCVCETCRRIIYKL